MRQPPAKPCGILNQLHLPAGSRLWRVHEQEHAADGFCPVPADVLFGGGRFDSTSSDAYPFCYAGLTPETALCETLLRGLAFKGRKRQLPLATIRGRTLSCLVTSTPLVLLSLTDSVDLASICQPDDWLLRADGHEYAHTRAWAHWLRQQAAGVHGLIWRSRYNMPHEAVVLFGDRCPGNGAVPAAIRESRVLDDDDGRDFLNKRLAPYRVTIAGPRPRPSAQLCPGTPSCVTTRTTGSRSTGSSGS